MTAPATAAEPHYTFVFVCQAGELEIKALLLAASLKRFVRGAYELVAAVPTPAEVWGELAPATRQLLRTLDIRVESIVNPIGTDYPIGNKLACLNVPARDGKIVFLDSDILCLRPMHDGLLRAAAFAAKPADLRTFSADTDVWRPLYAAAGASVPQLQMPTTVSGEFGLAYFNSGVVCADTQAHLGAAWLDCARRILPEPVMQANGHWLDQVSLAIAVNRSQLAYTSLDERYNFPAHLKPLSAPLPFLCHYHWPRIVRSEPALLEQVQDLVREFPAIGTLMARDTEWAALLAAPRVVRPARGLMRRELPPATDLMIAGIPDSGAESLAHQLARFDQCVVHEVADADAIAMACTQHPPAWAAAVYVRDMRCDIRERAAGSVQIRADVIVALSSPLVFACRLDALKRVLPQARFVACVRNPFDTIAQWKSGETWARIRATIIVLAESAAKWLPAEDAGQLRRIASLDAPAEQRAAVWWWLAQRLLDHSHAVTIVRYADWVSDRQAVLDGLLRGLRPGRILPAVADDTAGAQALDAADQQAIRAICLQAATELGVL